MNAKNLNLAAEKQSGLKGWLMETKEEEKAKDQVHHGNQMSDEELEEHFKAFQDIEECIEGLKEDGDDI